jgi:hypothetical protein
MEGDRMPKKRRCRRCDEEKPLDDFYRARARRDRTARFYSDCKSCHNEVAMARQRAVAASRSADGKKACETCRQVKPLADFYMVTTTRDGYGRYCKPCARAAARGRARYDTRKKKEYGVKCLYGLSLSEVEERWNAQGGRCVICRTPGEPVIDHDHTTGAFRGLTSSNCSCNSAMGFFRDDPDLCLAAHEYLMAARRVEVVA